MQHHGNVWHMTFTLSLTYLNVDQYAAECLGNDIHLVFDLPEFSPIRSNMGTQYHGNVWHMTFTLFLTYLSVAQYAASWECLACDVS